MQEQRVLLVLLLSTFAAGQQCGPGWTYFQESCYFFDIEIQTWYNAKSICETVGGRLAEVQTVEENNYLVSLMKQHHVTWLWLGLEDFVQEGHFVWAHYQEVPEWALWNPHEPNDQNGREDCASLVLPSGKWNDAQCDVSTYAFVCEQESGYVSQIG